MVEEAIILPAKIRTQRRTCSWFTEEAEGILLTSYEIPAGYDKQTFTYEAMTEVDFQELHPSEKFTPALYTQRTVCGRAEASACFPPSLSLRYLSVFQRECLEVSVTMEVNGKRTFGYDEPILYKEARTIMPEQAEKVIR